MGVDVETIKEGQGGATPKKGCTVTVHYTGTLKDGGKKFDSSRDRGSLSSSSLELGKLSKMTKGERSKLTISPDYAYGAKGVSGVIPPNATLVFDVELIDFK